MKKFILYSFIFNFLLLYSIHGQITFERLYSSISDSSYYAIENIKPTSDGGFIVTGNVSDSLVYGCAWMMKLDSAGMKEWSKGYSVNWSWGHDAIETTDNGYILAGIGHHPSCMEDIFLIKTDHAGDTLWTMLIGGCGKDEPRVVFQTPDHGYMVAATTDSYGTGHLDLMLMKTDTSGYPLWARYYGTYDTLFGNTNDEGLMDAIQLPGGGYLLAGWVYYKHEALLIETDSSGNVIWAKSFETSLELSSIKSTSDGYLITAGSSLIKTDLQGNILWEHSFAPWPLQAILSNDGNTVWVNVIGLAKADSLGNVFWNNSLTIPNGIFPNFRLILPIGGNQFLIAGQVDATSENSAFVFIRTDTMGNSSCFHHDTTLFNPGTPRSQTVPTIMVSSTLPTVINHVTTISDVMLLSGDCLLMQSNDIESPPDVRIYPNPAMSQFTVDSKQFAIGQIEIFNSLGEKIYSASFWGHSTVDCRLLPRGIYFVRFSNPEYYFVQKLIIE